jgi:hypothetical protein
MTERALANHSSEERIGASHSRRSPARKRVHTSARLGLGRSVTPITTGKWLWHFGLRTRCKPVLE